MSVLGAYACLAVAICAEIGATTALTASDGFTRWRASLVAILGYSVAFYLLSLTVRVIPTGIAYAIWSGVGMVLIALIAWLRFKQSLDLPAIFGMALIIAGVLVVNLFSRSVS